MNAPAPIRYQPVISLRALALEAISAANAFNACATNGPEWDALLGQADEAKASFLAALDVFGLDKAMLADLAKLGVL